ncbi:MAG TPA: glycolate oxidase subunit GlcE [Gammaproteobacteria bacterium]|nr:glycolate oxidase subunit GlcE [Gammaproteobacteria bacterium]
MDADRSREITDRVTAAAAAGTALEIRGLGSKRFYGRTPVGEPLELGGHSGIVRYQPSELVLTVRAGTSLEEIDAVLSEAGQTLPFDPPRYAGGSFGGAVAAGLSGPSRPFVGPVRDFVLGIRLINGRGEILRFGGEVMKNVAGYDVSRLMVGALGTLGVLLEVSVKVLPAPQLTRTRRLELARQEASSRIRAWVAAGLPVTGAAHDGEVLRVRLAGAAPAVEAAISEIGGEVEDNGFWTALRDHGLAFFTRPGPALWRIALPPATPELELAGASVADWNGQQIWLRSEETAGRIREAATVPGGHAALFRGGGRDREDEVFEPPAALIWRLHARLKQAFDPHGIFNPGRLYAEL